MLINRQLYHLFTVYHLVGPLVNILPNTCVLLQVKLIYSEAIVDVQLVGVKFCDKQGTMFAVTGYDLGEIQIFKK